jgi:hypothetical protein
MDSETPAQPTTLPRVNSNDSASPDSRSRVELGFWFVAHATIVTGAPGRRLSGWMLNSVLMALPAVAGRDVGRAGLAETSIGKMMRTT